MALSPIKGSNTLQRITEKKETFKPSRTYEFNFDTGEFTGQMIDKKEALEQFVRKTLATPRFQYLIYDARYGEEVTQLVGEDVTSDFLASEIPRLVKEALIYDDRVADVSEFVITKDPASDKVICEFVLTAVDGYIIEIKEVTF